MEKRWVHGKAADLCEKGGTQFRNGIKLRCMPPLVTFLSASFLFRQSLFEVCGSLATAFTGFWIVTIQLFVLLINIWPLPVAFKECGTVA